MGLSSTEQRIMDQTSTDKAFEHIRWLTDNAPDRLAGTDGEKRAVSYLCRTLGEYGVSHEVYEIDSYISVPLESKLEITHPVALEVESLPLAHSASTSADGIRGQLVFVGSGAEEKYQGIDVSG